MKRLLLSMAVIFAFSISSQAQWGPGEDFGLNPGLPDLVITGWDLPATATQTPGAFITVTVHVANVGSGPSTEAFAAFSGVFNYVNGGAFTGGAGAVIPPLGAESATTISVNMYIGSFLPLANVIFGCELDFAHMVAESNEDNNISVAPAVIIL